LIQSRSTDLDSKKRMLLLDLLVAGSAYYRAKPSVEGTNV